MQRNKNNNENINNGNFSDTRKEINHGGAAWSKDTLSDDRDDSRLLIPAGIFFVVMGGWLLSRWTYCSVVFGFVND